MVNNKKTIDKTTKVIRWTSRILGSISGAFWVLALTLSTIMESKLGVEPTPEAKLEGTVLGFLIAIVVIGVIIAWFREGIGGFLTTLGAIALSIFSYISAGHNKIFAVLTSGIPFLIAGILFLISWWRLKRL
ncbi:MAG: hypothetical protein WBA71_02675 [Candidatus Humimicrobiia bacterium]